MIHSYNKLPDAVGGHKSNISLKFKPLYNPLFGSLLGAIAANRQVSFMFACNSIFAMTLMDVVSKTCIILCGFRQN